MTKVKICGITNIGDALCAVRCAADMLGFNFYENSRRYVTPDDAAEIAARLSTDVWKVGIFVNMNVRKIGELVTHVGLDAVQIHGDEDATFVEELRNETDAKIIKAFRISEDILNEQIDDCRADLILLDTFSVGEYGGTGQLFDWSVIDPVYIDTRLVLAGGLTAENVAEAVRKVRPYAVDVASGVEISPGKKDPSKVEAFVRAAKHAL